MAWFDRLKEGLNKTRTILTTDVRDLNRVWEMEWDDLEFALIAADTGRYIAADIVKDAKAAKERGMSFQQALEKAMVAQLTPTEVTTHTDPVGKVVMVVGVNGVGKTTTIAKLGKHYQDQGKRVMFAAGDTFRAAATAQLQTWGQRLNIPTVVGPDGGDPGAVAFDAAQSRKARGADLLFVDTAGRLHTKHNLMEELKKVKRVVAKADPDEPQDIWLVLDAVTGQNGLAQARKFHEAVGLTGVVVTKLDGTAKGGILLPIVRELGLPIKFIGVGEQADDLHPFDAREFVRALLDMPEPAKA